MIGPTPKHTFYLCDVAVDFRKGFNGLSGMIKDYLGRNPLDGSAYVFLNAHRNRVKILLWEGDGFYVLESILPDVDDNGVYQRRQIEIQEGDQLSLLYEGYNINTNEETLV